MAPTLCIIAVVSQVMRIRHWVKHRRRPKVILTGKRVPLMQETSCLYSYAQGSLVFGANLREAK
ncbi:hypothetical protein C0J52_24995 [Blattella germanica]|nr:hypothetical protein C0J52_24995 [Blattella germanica]